MERVNSISKLLLAPLLTITMAVSLICCATTTKTINATEDRTLELPQISNTPKRDGLDTVMILLPWIPETRQVYTTLKEELQEDFNLFTKITDDAVTVEQLGALISSVEPDCLVLMGNRIVHRYRDYQRAQPEGAAFPASVAVMTSYLGSLSGNMIQTTGIAYEVSELTIFQNLREILDRPVNRVGVLYRNVLKPYLQRQIEFAKMEQIETIGIELGQQPTAENIRNGVRALRDVHEVDAVWILNDNAMLRDRELIVDGWLNELSKQPMPVVVGIPNLVKKEISLGNIALVPDHSALGIQTANLVFDLYDNEWQVQGRQVEQPLSIQFVIDIEFARQHLKLNEKMMRQFDIVQR